MLCYRGISSRAEPLDCAIANLEVIGQHSFRCYRHVTLQSLTRGGTPYNGLYG